MNQSEMRNQLNLLFIYQIHLNTDLNLATKYLKKVIKVRSEVD